MTNSEFARREPVRGEILLLGPVLPVVEATLRANGLGTVQLGEAPDQDVALARVAPEVRGVAGSFAAPVDAALFDRLPRLEIIASFGAGYDNVDTRAAAARGIVVTNSPGVLTEEVADTALGLLLATVRELPQANRYLLAGKWLDAPYPLTGTLRRKTVGIFGLGRIGKAIARRCEAFGLAIAYHGRTRQAEVSYAYYPTLIELARAVDILMVMAPGGPETRNAVDAEVLRALGPDGVLVNMARGSLVDEPALIEALASRTIHAAGLDVFADEPRVPAALLALDNVVLLPHVGSATVHTRDAMGKLVADNLVSWFAGRGPLTPVPETPWPARPRRG
jgi:lactate dehydrogenase-like 2-hydroxyacid dehydrogenase